MKAKPIINRLFFLGGGFLFFINYEFVLFYCSVKQKMSLFSKEFYFNMTTYRG